MFWTVACCACNEVDISTTDSGWLDRVLRCSNNWSITEWDGGGLDCLRGSSSSSSGVWKPMRSGVLGLASSAPRLHFLFLLLLLMLIPNTPPTHVERSSQYPSASSSSSDATFKLTPTTSHPRPPLVFSANCLKSPTSRLLASCLPPRLRLC